MSAGSKTDRLQKRAGHETPHHSRNHQYHPSPKVLRSKEGSGARSQQRVGNEELLQVQDFGTTGATTGVNRADLAVNVLLRCKQQMRKQAVTTQEGGCRKTGTERD
jgi:hypothetical protein